MGKTRFTPRTRKFNEREIVRRQNTFNKGMRPDIDPTDIPDMYGSVQRLYNANGYEDAIRGRKGSSLWNTTELPEIASITTLERDGITVTCASECFTDEMVNHIIYCNTTDEGDNTYFVIDKVIDENAVEVHGDWSNTLDTLNTCKVVGRVNAHFYDVLTGFEYYLVGKRIYTIGAANVWKEHFTTSGSIVDSNSQFFKIEDRVVLNNLGGIFTVSDILSSSGDYAYQMNGEQPFLPLGGKGRTKSEFSNPSTYRYAYTYSRIKGNILSDRNDESTFIEVETPPFFKSGDVQERTDITPSFTPEDGQEDFYQVDSPVPIESTTYKLLSISSSDYENFKSWVDLSEDNLDPFIRIDFNGALYNVYFDFSGVTSLSDVGSAMARSFEDISSRFKVRLVNNIFSLYNLDSENTFSFELTGGTGFNLISEGVLLTTNKAFDMGVSVGAFHYPETRNDITHYSLYRTRDVSGTQGEDVNLNDETIASDPNVFAWVADVPVCGGYVGDLNGVAGTFTLTDGSKTDPSLIDTALLGGTGVGYSVSIKSIINDTTYEIFSSHTEADVALCYGASYLDIETSSKDGKIVTSTKTFADDDVGKQIFWFDGDVSIIESVSDLGVATTLDSTDKASQNTLMNPTYREHYDTINDRVRDGYLSAWPLQTRYYTSMPNTNISAYTNGILMSASRSANGNIIHYSGTERFRSLGYHSEFYQVNNTIEKDIKCILVVNNLFGIFTSNQTYNINPKQGQVLTTDFGEYYTWLPDPFLVNGNVGTTHQFKWTYGDRGDVLMVTNEPAVRFFNGTQYERDRSKNMIRVTELQQLSPTMIVSYSTGDGVLIWGSRNG